MDTNVRVEYVLGGNISNVFFKVNIRFHNNYVLSMYF